MVVNVFQVWLLKGFGFVLWLWPVMQESSGQQKKICAWKHKEVWRYLRHGLFTNAVSPGGLVGLQRETLCIPKGITKSFHLAHFILTQ